MLTKHSMKGKSQGEKRASHRRKTLVLMAAERDGENIGRIRLTHIKDAASKTSSVGENLLSRCHRVASLFKRWIMGTLQGSLREKHLSDYLNEFTFRFNRRKSESSGKLFYRLAQVPVQFEATPYAKIAGTSPAEEVEIKWILKLFITQHVYNN